MPTNSAGSRIGCEKVNIIVKANGFMLESMLFLRGALVVALWRGAYITQHPSSDSKNTAHRTRKPTADHLTVEAECRPSSLGCGSVTTMR